MSCEKIRNKILNLGPFDEIEAIDIIYKLIKNFKSINPTSIGYRKNENNMNEFTFELSNKHYTQKDRDSENKILKDCLPNNYIINYVSVEYVVSFE